MIALDREMPQSCLLCPCLYTLHIKDISIRCCNAAGLQKITEPLKFKRGETVPEWWMEFPKPDWCPWVEV